MNCQLFKEVGNLNWPSTSTKQYAYNLNLNNNVNKKIFKFIFTILPLESADTVVSILMWLQVLVNRLTKKF